MFRGKQAPQPRTEDRGSCNTRLVLLCTCIRLEAFANENMAAAEVYLELDSVELEDLLMPGAGTTCGRIAQTARKEAGWMFHVRTKQATALRSLVEIRDSAGDPREEMGLKLDEEAKSLQRRYEHRCDARACTPVHEP